MADSIPYASGGARHSPIFVDPHVGSFLPTFLVQVLKRTIEVGIELPPHKKAAKTPSELGAEAATTALHEAANQGGRDGRKFMIGESPVPGINRLAMVFPKKRQPDW